mgnify:CR=1 FL=1
MITTKVDAIKSLVPLAEMIMRDDEIISWTGSDPQPTEDQITAERTRLDGLRPINLLREERNRLLAVSDWTQSRDITLSNDDAWKTYRQALRDLPASASPKLDAYGNLDLTSVTFPTEPS